jgi:hypothetical protein
MLAGMRASPPYNDGPPRHEEEEDEDDEDDDVRFGPAGPNADPDPDAERQPPPRPAPGPRTDNPYNLPEPELPDLQILMGIIRQLAEATHENADIPDKEREAFNDRMENPAHETFRLDDPDVRLSLDLYLASAGAPRDTYAKSSAAFKRRCPEIEILSYETIAKRVADWTNIHVLRHDMCVNSCLGFTTVYSGLDICPDCTQPRYMTVGNKRVPRKQFYTLLLAPTVQARFSHPQGARAMKSGVAKLKQNLELSKRRPDRLLPTYRDIYSGKDLLDHYEAGHIGDWDVLVGHSHDGMQVFGGKESDMWVGIWLLAGLPADTRYKKTATVPAYLVPGPGKIRRIETFQYPSFHHVRACMRQGFRVWDADVDVVERSRFHMVFAGADAPAMTGLDGAAGPNSAHSCRDQCPMRGRLKGTHYYPALLLPDNYHVEHSDHPDIDAKEVAQHQPSQDAYLLKLGRLLRARTQTEFDNLRLASGLSRPSIFLAFPDEFRLPIPNIWVLDNMHVNAINSEDLLCPLWNGTLECDRTDSVDNWPWAAKLRQKQNWQLHGKETAEANRYFPTWYGRPPRDIAEFFNSQYKAIERVLHLYGLGPMTMPKWLPFEYYRHFTKLVRCFEIDQEEEITLEEVLERNTLTTEFCKEYEELYVKRLAGRLHFVRPWLHTILHFAQAILRRGPTCYYSQWTIERVIGLLKDQLRNKSNAYANLAMVSTRLCQQNALKAMMPELDDTRRTLGPGEYDLGDGYALLRPKEDISRPVTADEAVAIAKFKHNELDGPAFEDWSQAPGTSVVRYARLAIANGSVARTAWKEKQRMPEKVKITRMVEVCFVANWL